jgi:hypothetical protein
MSLKKTKYKLEGMGHSQRECKTFLLPWPPPFVARAAVDLF